jgi:hypothetical protein
MTGSHTLIQTSRCGFRDLREDPWKAKAGFAGLDLLHDEFSDFPDMRHVSIVFMNVHV